MWSSLVYAKLMARLGSSCRWWGAARYYFGLLWRGEIYLALVDPDGTVHALIEGDVTEGKVEQLCAAFTPDFIINRLQRIMVLIRH